MADRGTGRKLIFLVTTTCASCMADTVADRDCWLDTHDRNKDSGDQAHPPFPPSFPNFRFSLATFRWGCVARWKGVSRATP
eukprot:4875196-Pleurochrysis_carterae.AAC.1